jgi:hypothetical protein
VRALLVRAAVVGILVRHSDPWRNSQERCTTSVFSGL